MKKVVTGVVLASLACLVVVTGTVQATTRKEKKIQTLENRLEKLRATPSPRASATPRPSPTARPTPTPPDNTCIKTTVAKRETAVAGSFDSYSTAMKNALSARKTSLNDAWSKSTQQEQRKAVVAAWKNYHNARQNAKETLRKATNSAWDTFKKENRACRKAGDVYEDNAGFLEDNLI